MRGFMYAILRGAVVQVIELNGREGKGTGQMCKMLNVEKNNFLFHFSSQAVPEMTDKLKK